MKPFLILILTLLTSCQSPESQHSAAQAKNITIKIGESGESFTKRYPELLGVNRQPAGLDFYEINLDTKPRGTVRIDHGKHSFEIKKAMVVMGTLNHDFSDEGIAKFYISAGLVEKGEGRIFHDTARLQIYGILQEIVNAGWKSIISESSPRISGQARLDYVLNNTTPIALEPTPVPTPKEWVQIEDGAKWEFYADHLYLVMSFRRSSKDVDPEKPASYLLSFDIISEAEHYKGYVAPENRANWKAQLPASLDRAKQRRAKAEAELIAKGIKIDTDYQGPPLPELE